MNLQDTSKLNTNETGKKILEVKGVSFSYDAKKADSFVLDNVSLSMEEGGILCLMGQNGSGKSTLLNCIMGINKTGAGEVILDGKNIREYSRTEMARHVAFVPQIHNISFPYTVREAVLMGRNAYIPAFGSPSKKDYEICEMSMERVGISKLADRSYGNISGGELRLVLLARALCQQTKLILMDEPTAHLDYHNELFFMETLTDLCKKDGLSVLMATHAPSQAFYFSARGIKTSTVFMKKGKVMAEGTPDEIITSELLREVYDIEAKILEDNGEKTILLQRSI